MRTRKLGRIRGGQAIDSGEMVAPNDTHRLGDRADVYGPNGVEGVGRVSNDFDVGARDAGLSPHSRIASSIVHVKNVVGERLADKIVGRGVPGLGRAATGDGMSPPIQNIRLDFRSTGEGGIRRGYADVDAISEPVAAAVVNIVMRHP